MTKNVLLLAFLILSLNSIAQKAQRIGYIDMEYILQNIPDYNEAQNKINAKAITWQNNIASQQKEIEDLKTELNNEKALLTKELIVEKEEDIQIKETELKKLQETYFGSNGDLFFLRQQLVQPIQDLVYNAVQDIASKRNYDFIFDKSSDLIMLFSNKQYDVSELVISSITRTEKLNEVKAKREALTNKESATVTNDDGATENALSEREQKRAELQQKLEEKKAEQLKKREALKKAIEDKRLQRIKEIEEAKKAKEAKKENN
jgi:Skp family chaperone for outer membrane proteins